LLERAFDRPHEELNNYESAACKYAAMADLELIHNKESTGTNDLRAVNSGTYAYLEKDFKGTHFKAIKNKTMTNQFPHIQILHV
jgi:hypothetical protein